MCRPMVTAYVPSSSGTSGKTNETGAPAERPSRSRRSCRCGVGAVDEPPHGVVDGDPDDDVVDRLGGFDGDIEPQRLAGLDRLLVGSGVDDPGVGDLHPAPHRRHLRPGQLGAHVLCRGGGLEEPLPELPDDLVRFALGHELAVFEGRRLVAHLPDEVGGVGDDHDRAALGLEGLDLVDALPLEGLVADGEDLVDEEDLRVDVDGHGEAEPDVHARRVVLDRRVDELLQLGEGRRCRRTPGRPRPA